LAADGRLHITDFGLARLIDEPSMTHSGEMLGTPAYMSPEQIDAESGGVDHRTDIYSLGVTLYELLTGRRPFEAPTRDQILARIRQREPRAPRKINPLVPIDLETICLRAMEKDPRRRYQNAGAMRDDLVRYADHRPIVSRRVRAAERAFKWVRRHPAMTTITSLSIALTVVAVLWSRQASASRREKADSLVAKAIELLTYDNYRDWEQARGYLTVAEKLDPEPARLAVAEGMCHLVGNPKLAIEHFHRAIELEPSNIRVMYLLGWACRADQQLSAFREWVAKADAASGPGSDAVAHFFRGQALVRLDPLEATKNYRTAERLSDSFYQVKLHLARALNHEMYHRRTLENFGEIKRTLEAACILRQKAAYPRYLLSLASRLAGEIYRDLGNAALARVNFDAALQSALDAQRVEPDSPQSHTCEAEYWESQGDLVRALGARDRGAEHCKSALDRLELHEYRWRLCYWLGQHDRAMSDLSELVKLCSPTDPKLKWHLHLFPALILADMGRIDESIAKARLLASESPGEFRAIVSAAALLRTHGASDEADQLVRDARRKWEASQNKSPAGQARQRLLLLDFFEGHRTWGELTAEIAKDSSLEALMPKAHFTAGCRALAEGDRELAASCFRACEITYDFDDYCYAGRVFAVRLQGDSTWPNWLARH
ncbi:MAG TPA: protein kinase, partial [Phycisphaerae bacterium]|nr:protein kinase [Phycisphaerae bacterium]